MDNVVCWDKKMVRKALDTEALEVPWYVFLATHHPVRMFRSYRDKEAKEVYDEEQLLNDFLSEKDFLFIPVLGYAGVGKSHLVRWLGENIQDSPNRKVLLIRKVNTNLKSIIEQILDGMEGEKFEEYRSRLRKASGFLSEKEARIRLLQNLSVSVGPHGPNSKGDLTDIQSWLIENLPDLLDDPHFGSFLKRDEGIIHRLTLHALGNIGQVERLEERRQFSLDDLPLKIKDLQKASEKARNFFGDLIGNNEVQEETVAWLNKNLDDAISGLLNFKGEDLLELMLGVREALAEQDMELVFLIEDFAKLQGIDRQLLEAILVRPREEGRKVCNLKTAIAVTTGYYQSLEATVQQRTSFVINLDVPSDRQDGYFNPEEKAEFASRYLNAIRYEENELKEILKGSDLGKLPSACKNKECPYLEKCHEAFGQVNEYGLYPFNKKALQNMYQRRKKDQFIPRFFIKEVLRHILENYSDDLKGGEFPPPHLIDHFGGSSLSAFLTSELKEKDPQNNERRKVLIELWDSGDRIKNLHPGIHKAFKIPLLESVEEKDQNDIGSEEDETPKPNPTDEGFVPESIKKIMQELDDWKNKKYRLSQGTTQKLRNLLFDAINQRIDWDNKGLVDSFFIAGELPLFRVRGINFQEQETQFGASPVLLFIPKSKEEDFTDSALALQGLIQYNHFKNWNFEKGDYYFKKYSKKMDEWAEEIENKIFDASKNDGSFYPVAPLVKVLSYCSAILGLLKENKDLDVTIINSFFQNIEEAKEYSVGSWGKLEKEVVKNRDELISILGSFIKCKKGKTSQSQIIDYAKIKPFIEEVTSEVWKEEILPELKNKYRNLEKLLGQLNTILEIALKEKREDLKSWLDFIQKTIGDKNNLGELVSLMNKSMVLVSEEGVAPPNIQKLRDLKEMFNLTNFEKTYEKVQGVLEDEPSTELSFVARIGLNNQKGITFWKNFFEEIDKFLNSSIEKVESRIRELKENKKNPEEKSEAINQTLLELKKGLALFEEVNN